MAKRTSAPAASVASVRPNSDVTAAASPDPFVQLSLTTWEGLNAAVREASWIADGGDPTVSFADRDMAALKRAEYDRERIRIMQRLMAYLAKQLSVSPPSATDLDRAKVIATRLAEMREVNVTFVAIMTAATELLALYGKS